MRFFMSFLGVPLFGLELSIPSRGLYLPNQIPSEHQIDLMRELEHLEVEHFDFNGEL